MDIPLNNEKIIKCKKVVIIYLDVLFPGLCLLFMKLALWLGSAIKLDLMILKICSNINDSMVPACHAVLALGSARLGSAWISPKVFRGTSGQMMCETRDHCVPAQRWPWALPTGAGPGQRSLLTSLLPTTPQGFKHLSPSFLRCPNLGTMCGLGHPKWCLLKPAESRGKWKVSLHIAGGYEVGDLPTQTILGFCDTILWRLIDHLKRRLCSHLPTGEAMGEMFLSLIVLFMEMSLLTRYKQMK